MFLISELVVLLATNLILTQALGISTLFMAVSSRKNLLWTAITISVFTTLGSFGACLVNGLLPDKLYDLRLLLYMLIIGVIYVIVLTVLYFVGRKSFGTTRKYVHLSAFNCAVMGTLFTVSDRADDSLLSYMIAGAEAGTGFILAAFILMSAFRRLSSKEVPASFRGFPSMLVYLGIISMAIYALV